jgi:hypothetical protein
MKNLTMRSRLRRGEALDVSRCGRTRDGDYVLPIRMHPPKRKDPKDYCDSTLEAWVESIGRNRRTGKVVASLSGKFYKKRGWECIWLR